MSIFKKDTSFKKLVFAFAPPVLWAGIIFLFSSQTTLPGFELSVYDFILKKSAHIIVYLILYLLVFRSLTQTFQPEYKKSLIILPILICLIYAASDEFHQSLVPGRYSTLRDIGFDMIGVGIAFFKKYDYI